MSEQFKDWFKQLDRIENIKPKHKVKKYFSKNEKKETFKRKKNKNELQIFWRTNINEIKKSKKKNKQKGKKINDKNFYFLNMKLKKKKIFKRKTTFPKEKQRLETINNEYFLKKKKVREFGIIIKKIEKKKHYMPVVQKKKDKKQSRLYKDIQRLLNRLTEANIIIINDMAEIYQKEVKFNVSSYIVESIIQNFRVAIIVLENLCISYAALIVALHIKINYFVGSFMLEQLAFKFNELWSNLSKETFLFTKNILLLLVHLFNFKLIYNGVLFDLLNLFVERFLPLDIDLIYLVVLNSEFQLQNENAIHLKNILISIEKKKSSINKEEKNDKGDSFEKLKEIYSLINKILFKKKKKKNLNLMQTKFQGFLLELNMKIKSMTRSQMLYIGWKDLMNIRTSGRWWIVGNVWKPLKKKIFKKIKNEQENLLRLAVKFKMNSKLRRKIFISIMGANSPMNAFERLEKIKLKPKQEREVVRILFKMLMEIKQYKPFFSYLLQKLCDFHRHYRFTTQVAIWHQIKDFNSLTLHEMRSFGSTIGQLIATCCIPLSCLKYLNFSEHNNLMILFLNSLLTNLFKFIENKEQVFKVFTKLNNEKLNVLREFLVAFFEECFIIKLSYSYLVNYALEIMNGTFSE